MKPKEAGIVVAIDPASNECGVSIWRDGNFVAGRVLKSGRKTDVYPQRLRDIAKQFGDFLSEHIGDEKINTVVSEGVRSRIVQVSLGALLTEPRVDAAISPKGSFVESPQWKNWAKKRGASGFMKDVKGVKALREIGWPVDEHGVESDDVADSVLIYLCWRDR